MHTRTVEAGECVILDLGVGCAFITLFELLKVSLKTNREIAELRTRKREDLRTRMSSWLGPSPSAK